MAIPENRLSSEVVDALYIPPEGEDRIYFLHDMEGGPIAVADTSEGMNHQKWYLSYASPKIWLTPEVGAPVNPVSAVNINQASFCFDQNAQPSVVYTTNEGSYLYWYDSYQSIYVTDDFPGVTSAMLSLDDKRTRQVTKNDMILWYTKEVTPGEYRLYTRVQRERFQIEHEMRMEENTPLAVPPYLWKAGMHAGLRGKVTLTYRTP